MSVDPNEISCKELIELITEYLEGRLPPDEKRKFEDHLSICEACLLYLEQMRETIRAVGRLSEESLPVHAKEDLLALFRNWKGN
jgi:anti-sigma factor RsiW